MVVRGAQFLLNVTDLAPLFIFCALTHVDVGKERKNSVGHRYHDPPEPFSLCTDSV